MCVQFYIYVHCKICHHHMLFMSLVLRCSMTLKNHKPLWGCICGLLHPHQFMCNTLTFSTSFLYFTRHLPTLKCLEWFEWLSRVLLTLDTNFATRSKYLMLCFSSLKALVSFLIVYCVIHLNSYIDYVSENAEWSQSLLFLFLFPGFNYSLSDLLQNILLCHNG